MEGLVAETQTIREQIAEFHKKMKFMRDMQLFAPSTLANQSRNIARTICRETRNDPCQRLLHCANVIASVGYHATMSPVTKCVVGALGRIRRENTGECDVALVEACNLVARDNRGLIRDIGAQQLLGEFWGRCARSITDTGLRSLVAERAVLVSDYNSVLRREAEDLLPYSPLAAFSSPELGNEKPKRKKVQAKEKTADPTPIRSTTSRKPATGTQARVAAVA